MKTTWKSALFVIFLVIFCASFTNAQMGEVTQPGGGGGKVKVSGSANQVQTTDGNGNLQPTPATIDQSGNISTPGAVSIGNAYSVGIPGTKADGKIGFDGAMASLSTAGANTTSATTPTIVTYHNNDVVLSIFGLLWYNNLGISGVNAAVTQRAYFAGNGNYNGLYLGDQTVSSPGTVPAVTGTLSNSNSYIGAQIALFPISGTSMSYVGSSVAHPGSGTSLTLSIPAGTAAGDMAVACVEWNRDLTAGTPYSPQAVFATPTGWTSSSLILQQYMDTHNAQELACWQHIVTLSEITTGSYTWTWTVQAPGTNQSGALVTYHNSAGANTIGVEYQQFTSAGASFQCPGGTYPCTSGGDVGKLICIDQAGANSAIYYSTAEQCGTVAKINSSITLLTNFTNSNPAAISSAQYIYASDDSTAIQSYINGLTYGGEMHFGEAIYGMSTGFSLPPNISIQLVGQGSGMSNSQNSLTNSTTTPVNANSGTRLWFLTKSMTGPALSISGTAGNTSATGNEYVGHLTLYGGVGKNFDGGGADCVDVMNWQGLLLDDVYCVNFAGHGSHVNVLTNQAVTDYIENVEFHKFYATFNGGFGVEIGDSTILAKDIETVKIDSSVIEANQKGGLYINGYANNGAYVDNIQGFSLTNSVLQWNNISGTKDTTGASIPEIWISGGNVMGGLSFKGNYIEVDNVAGSQSNQAITQSWYTASLNLSDGNWCFPGKYCAPIVFSHTSTFYLDLTKSTCDSGGSSNNTIHKWACVSDSTACTNGTTYTTGGSTLCRVECNGTNWVETGTSAGCN
jgi:hypothetical protein